MSCKVRFAPSPTGYMHVGNARVAIINYLFCQKNKGHFLFRIDDTDKERSKKEYEDAIQKDLKWLGIEYDSTFRQSERLARYDEIKNQLLNKGLLYKCYESQEELAYKRKLAIGKGIPPVYDRAALQLSEVEKSKLEASGIKPYLRFKLPDITVSWNDLVLGEVSYNLRNVSDPVIIKADGTYLYTFSSVIDDYDYDITHIIRGQDHTTNTAVQIAIWNAISDNKYSVDFAHLSLLVNKDGSQFSKRLGSLNLAELRNEGMEPMSIWNLLATLGSSLDIKPFTCIDDLIEYFDITKFSTNSPKFDVDDLWNLNKKIIRRYSYQDIANRLETQEHLTQNQFNIVHENVDRVSDFSTWQYIFSDNFKSSYQFSDDDKKVLSVAIQLVDKVDLQDWIEKTKQESGVSGKSLYMPIRIALTDMQHGPNITDIAFELGVETIKKRLKLCMN